MRTSPVWSPEQYGTYADERGRPFADLVGRVRADGRPTVVDLGCGPGSLTATLREALAGGDHRRRRQLAADDRGGRSSSPTTS